MHKYLVIIRSIVCFLCCFILFASCGNTKDGPKTSKVVTQKISETKNTASPSKQQDSISPEAIGNNAEVKTGTQSAGTDKTDKNLIASVSDSDQTINLLNIGNVYNPEGKVDPFVPILRDERVKAVKGNTRDQRIKRIPSTPLEKLDLSQLKLVGIIQSTKGNKGLVEEASGKGYIITKGTYIGTRSGRVLEVLKDKIIIEEETENTFDGVTACKKELKLQKPTGEE